MPFVIFPRLVFKKKIVYLSVLLLMGIPQILKAQLWQGNLGLPILNLTFGTGTSKPLPYTASIYNYTTGCPQIKEYSLEHFLFGCANGTWVLLTGDHTGDVRGNYMLVNGATEKGTVLIDTIKGLCGNTNYQLSAFISNCLKNNACDGNPILTNLNLSIESVTGQVLATYNTGDIATTDFKTWIEYGTYCTTPANTEQLVIRIFNNSGGACGSVFIMDDITFKPAGSAIKVTVNKDTNLVLDLCKGYSNTYNFNGIYSSGYIDPVLQWQYSRDTGKTWKNIPGATTLNYLMPHRGDSLILYHLGISERVNAGNVNCSIYSDQIWTNVHPTPEVVPLQNVLGCLNKELVLKAPPEFSNVLWTRPNGFQSKEPWLKLPAVQYKDAGLYTVKIMTTFGCFIKDSFQVNILPGTTITTPTLYNICEGTPVNLAATGDGNFVWTPVNYLTNSTIGNPVASPVDSITDKVVLSNVYGCKDSARVNINVYKNPIVSAGPNKTILFGDSTRLEGLVQGTSVSYYWAPNIPLVNRGLLNPYVAPISETTYNLYAHSTLGCGDASAAVIIKVYKDVFMPKAFTPNGDGVNDVYHVTALAGFKIVSFTIFNRYGAKIFSTTDAKIGWDGTTLGQPQETGEYIYYLEIKNPSGKKINRRGSILLLR